MREDQNGQKKSPDSPNLGFWIPDIAGPLLGVEPRKY
jgi:hypothetical protein